ncbi:MAG TPA: aspartate aminotransferase family protein [Candidatus Limnocylindria bacterium]|nr:aspartate aminotransferase family protein [Candidatus Limnocylindria bacterium]
MAASRDLLARRDAVVPRGVPRVTTATVASGAGAVLTDLEGRELIDFAGGIGVMNAGHCNARVVEAIREQAGRLLHTCFHVATYEPYIELCEKLASLFPHGDRTKVLLVNSGAEAVENAVKIARQATGRPAVICYTESFHGRTLLGMSLTSKVKYKSGCGPFAPEIYRLPFPNRFLYGDGLGEAAFVERELQRLRDAFLNTVEADQVAAVLIEPVQGEGGFVPAPAGYLAGLRSICDEHGIALIFDEVQSGFCRTGAWAAYQHMGVVPDLSTWAKSLGGGLPIAAVVGRAGVMDGAAPGTIGGTYGGNPVACAAALATIEVMEELDLNRRAREIGERVRERFEALRDRCPALADVRGLGAMVGAEFIADGAPAGAQVGEVLKAALERGVLAISAGTHGNVIRVLSPLVIADAELDRGLDILSEEILRVFADASLRVEAAARV